MATLPSGWAADYDGQRWFFKYTATNHTQYHFPKPGDEFPDFSHFGDGFGGLGFAGVIPATELLPEERLESDRQVRRQGTADGNNQGGKKKKKSMEKQVGKEMEDEEGEDWAAMCSFSSFGCLGPGSFDDFMSSKTEEEEKEEKEQERLREHEGRPRSTGGVSSITPLTGSGTVYTPAPVSEAAAASFAILSDDPPVGVRQSFTPTVTPPTTKASFVAGEAIMTSSEAVHSALPLPLPPPPPARQPPIPELPMLDSREIARSPVGDIAELVSEFTARCEVEINPPPVELPDTGATWLEPVPVPNLVNQYPVELPALVSERPEGDWARMKRSKEEGEGKEKEKTTNTRASYVDPAARIQFASRLGHVITRDGGGDRPPARSAVTEVAHSSPGNEDWHAVDSRCTSSSQKTHGPKIPPKVPHNEKLHREIMDFFPDGEHIPRTIHIGATGPAEDTGGMKSASISIPGAGARHCSISSGTKLDHIPSILRPGPRRSSQPPLPGPGRGVDTRRWSQPATERPETEQEAASPSLTEHDPTRASGFRHFQPLRPQKGAAAGWPHSSFDTESSIVDCDGTRQYQPLGPQRIPGVGRPHPQCVVGGHDLHTCENRVVMPDPYEHIRVLSLPNGSTLPEVELPPCSLSRAPPYASPLRNRPLALSVGIEMPEPAAHINMSCEPSKPLRIPQTTSIQSNRPPRPPVPLKFPSAASIPAHMMPAPSRLFHMRREEAESSYYPPRISPQAGILSRAQLSEAQEPTAGLSFSPGNVDPKLRAPSVVNQAATASDTDTDDRCTSFAERTAASSYGVDAMSPEDKKLNHIWKRIAKPGTDGDTVAGDIVPIRVIGDEGQEVSAMGYMPPKGRQERVPEWSWGHAE